MAYWNRFLHTNSVLQQNRDSTSTAASMRTSCWLIEFELSEFLNFGCIGYEKTSSSWSLISGSKKKENPNHFGSVILALCVQITNFGYRALAVRGRTGSNWIIDCLQADCFNRAVVAECPQSSLDWALVSGTAVECIQRRESAFPEACPAGVTEPAVTRQGRTTTSASANNLLGKVPISIRGSDSSDQCL